MSGSDSKISSSSTFYIRNMKKYLVKPTPQTRTSKTFGDDEIRTAFQTFDLDKNMFVGVSEIRHILTLIGESATDDEIDEMIRLCDPDGSGHVNFDGFYKMFSGASQSIGPIPTPAVGTSQGQRRPSMDGTTQYANTSISQLLAEFTKGVDITPAYIRKVYKRFQLADKSRSGRIGYPDFLQVLESEDTPLMKKLFDLCDVQLLDEIDVKHFIVNLIINSKSIKVNEKIKIAFSMVRSSKDPENSMSRGSLVELLNIFFSGFPDERRKLDIAKRVDGIFAAAGIAGDSAEVNITMEQFMRVVTANAVLALPPIMADLVDKL